MFPRRVTPEIKPAYMLTSLFRIIPMALVMGIIFFFSHQPAEELGLPDVRFLDKVLHFLVYTLLGLTVCCGVSSALWSSRANIVRFAVVLFCLFYGISDEFHQAFIPGRHSSIIDVTADVFGGIASVLIYSLYLRTKKDPVTEC